MSAVNRTGAERNVRTVSSNEAKQHWGAMIKAVSEGESVVVESHGKAKAVVISPEAFEELKYARERQRREAAIEWLRGFEASYDGRNDDLSEEQIEEIALRVGREANAAAAEKQRARAEPKRTT